MMFRNFLSCHRWEKSLFSQKKGRKLIIQTENSDSLLSLLSGPQKYFKSANKKTNIRSFFKANPFIRRLLPMAQQFWSQLQMGSLILMFLKRLQPPKCLKIALILSIHKTNPLQRCLIAILWIKRYGLS